jgi:hypothetical protein
MIGRLRRVVKGREHAPEQRRFIEDAFCRFALDAKSVVNLLFFNIYPFEIG